MCPRTALAIAGRRPVICKLRRIRVGAAREQRRDVGVKGAGLGRQEVAVDDLARDRVAKGELPRTPGHVADELGVARSLQNAPNVVDRQFDEFGEQLRIETDADHRGVSKDVAVSGRQLSHTREDGAANAQRETGNRATHELFSKERFSLGQRTDAVDFF